MMAPAGVKNHLWFHLVILMSIAAISLCDDAVVSWSSSAQLSTEDPAPADCVYSFYIKTGPWALAGTDSKISAKFSNAAGNWVSIPNIEAWGGRMGPGYNYFEKGNVDIFSGKAPCRKGPICSLTLTSDGSGLLPAWNVISLDLITTGYGRNCERQFFSLEAWLVFPFLSTTKNNCGKAFAMEEDLSNGLLSNVSFVPQGMN